MKTTTLLSLLTAFLVTVGTSIWLLKQDNTSNAQVEQPLLGEFITQLPELTQVEVRDASGVILRAEKKANAWWATHLHPVHVLPVDVDSLVGLIDGLRSANKIEAKTQNAEQYARLGVEPIDQPESAAKRLTLRSATNSFEVIIGRQATSGLGSFVRLPDATQSWLIDQTLVLPEDSAAWLVNPLALVEVEEVSTVTRTSDDKYQLVRTAPDSGSTSDGIQSQWRLVDLDDDEQLVFPSILQTTVNSLLNTRFDSAIALDTVTMALTTQSEIVIDTQQGEQLEIRLLQENDNYFVGYTLASKPWLENWIFGLSSFNYEQINKGRSDLVEQPEEQGTPEEAPTPAQ